MKRGVWVGGVVVSLCAWSGGLAAQEVIARSAPLHPPVAASSRGPAPAADLPPLSPCPAAAIGRPAAGPGVESCAYLVTAPYLPPVTAPYLPPVAAAPAAPAAAPAPAADDALTDFAVERGRAPAYAVRTAEPFSGLVLASAVAPDEAYLPPPPDPEGAGLAGAEAAGPEDGPRGTRFYAAVEYLLWAVKKDHLPPLITTSAPQDFGILGRPTTRVLFGGDGLDGGWRSGARFTAGYWLDPCGEKAVEVSGFFLGDKTERFTANSAFFPVIARPFFSLNRNGEFSQLTAFPGVSTGNASVEDKSSLWGVEADLRCKACCGCFNLRPCGPGVNYRVDWLAGFRYLDLYERLTITEQIQNLPTSPPPFTNIRATVTDSFATRNQFYGGQIGADAEFRRGPWSLNVRGKLALGDTHQTLTINGSQVFLNPDGTQQVFKGGLLALSTNIGRFERDRFGVVPEINFNVGYQINDHWKAFVGYDVLYWSNVLRPGEQIDRVLDETLIPNFPSGAAPAGQNRPVPLFKESGFWAQGVNFGLEFRY
jgi:hypothetical protein